jgi:hypothetical protein
MFNELKPIGLNLKMQTYPVANFELYLARTHLGYVSRPRIYIFEQYLARIVRQRVSWFPLQNYITKMRVADFFKNIFIKLSGPAVITLFGEFLNSMNSGSDKNQPLVFICPKFAAPNKHI